MSPTSSNFGQLPDGRAIQAWRLGSPLLAATVVTYGARLTMLDIPVRGRRANLLVGPTDLAGCVADTAYMGVIAGRYANRIAGGRFMLDGQEVRLACNEGANVLHGGPMGFDRAVWHAAADDDAVILTHHSPHGDQGFPGGVQVAVRYAVTGDTLAIDYTATTDAPTVLNLTNHAYFNLLQHGDILGHVLTIPAEHFSPIDKAMIPTGEFRPVAGTAFDFRTPTAIGARIDAADEQLSIDPGYDHNFILGMAPSDTPRLAARVAAGGLALEVRTTEPGVQFYTGNFLGGTPFGRRTGLCLETQHFPDSPNRPDFPTTVLRPGQTFRSRTEFRLSAV